MPNNLIPYQNHLKDYARELRKHLTADESLLWEFIRKKKLGVEFHRQAPMLAYIIDFYCHEILLAIEIDGEYHGQVSQQFEDKQKNDNLNAYEVEVIHFVSSSNKCNFFL
jgi:very-short-patch-repair endonuclease